MASASRAREVLHHIERGRDQGVAAKAEDDPGGVHRAQPAETCPGPERRRLGPVKQRRDPDADAHAYDRPDQRHHEAEPGGRIVVAVEPVGRWHGAVVKRPAEPEDQREADDHRHRAMDG